jgi:hypothetical protein
MALTSSTVSDSVVRFNAVQEAVHTTYLSEQTTRHHQALAKCLIQEYVETIASLG